MYTILLVVLVLLLLGGLPHWPYARGWGAGYYPSGVVAILLVILVVMMITGRL